jgi:mono/diheme cytochrome c family protein
MLNQKQFVSFIFKIFVHTGTFLMIAIYSMSTYASEGKGFVEQQCTACHQVSLPAANSLNLSERISRKAPPLFYAGNKYQKEWLTAWLQNPKPITPSGGGYWALHVHVTDEGDFVKTNEIKPHVKLSSKDAKNVSDYLITLTPNTQLIKKNEYKVANVSKMLAEKNFRKFKGCGACHQDEAGYGGVTGPELYTAMKRLQPEYVASYIRDPTAWEPKTMMPNKHLNDASIYKLMNYLQLLGGK